MNALGNAEVMGPHLSLRVDAGVRDTCASPGAAMSKAISMCATGAATGAADCIALREKARRASEATKGAKQ